VLAACLLTVSTSSGDSPKKLGDRFPFLNQAGILTTHNTKGNGDIDLTGPFFPESGH